MHSDFDFSLKYCRVASTLERYLIEDQLFRDEPHWPVDEVNECGDGASVPNGSNIDYNKFEDLENFDQQEVKFVPSDEAKESRNMDQIHVIDDGDDDEKPTMLKIEEPKSDCEPKPRNSQTHHKCHHCVCCKSLVAARNFPRAQSPKIVDVDLVVHGVDDHILEEVECGTANISLISRKQHGKDALQPIENTSRKRCRKNLIKAEHFPWEMDEYAIERPPSPPPLTLTFKSRASRYMPKRIKQESPDLPANRNRFAISRETMISYNEQRWPFYEPQSRYFHPQMDFQINVQQYADINHL